MPPATCLVCPGPEKKWLSEQTPAFPFQTDAWEPCLPRPGDGDEGKQDLLHRDPFSRHWQSVKPTHALFPVVRFDISLHSSVVSLLSRKCECGIWAPPPGLQRVLQHTAGHASHGAAVVEQSGEESQHSCGEVHCEIHQPCSVSAGDLVCLLQHSDVWQHDCKSFFYSVYHLQ